MASRIQGGLGSQDSMKGPARGEGGRLRVGPRKEGEKNLSRGGA